MIEPVWTSGPEGVWGWDWRGKVHARELVGATFWVRAARVVFAGDGGCVDRVQTWERQAILTAGPVGGGAYLGGLPSLLVTLQRALLVEHLGKLAERTGLSLRDLPAPAFTIGLRTAQREDLERVFWGVSGPFLSDTPESFPALSQEWVVAFAGLLADPQLRRPLSAYWGERLRMWVPASMLRQLGTAEGSAPTGKEQQRTLAVFLALAAKNREVADRLFSQGGSDAGRMLDLASHPNPKAPRIAPMVQRLRAAMAGEGW